MHLFIIKGDIFMPAWDEYKAIARERGALAFELYVIETTPCATAAELQEILPAHIAYQQKLESEGKIFMAGPTSDATGKMMQGSGMIIYRAKSLKEAQEWADGDPMHSQNLRSYTLRKWLVNECNPAIISGIREIREE